MGGKKKIAIFTEFYPFGAGEEFLEDEIKVAERFFDEIALISFNKETDNVTKYIPKNAIVIPIKKRISQRTIQLKRILGLFSLDVWKQTFLCIWERGLNSLIEGMKSAIIEHSVVSVLKAAEGSWIGKYDIFYSYWLSGAASYLAARKKQLGGVLISRAHGYDCFFERGFHPHRTEQLQNLDMIFPISDAGREDLVRQGGDPDKIQIARLGVEKPNDKVNLFKKTGTKRIVTCSNIIELKRLDLLIEALSLINSVRIEWVHFGDGALREEIERLAKQILSEKKDISYTFMGRVQLNRIFEYYESESIDYFINCSDVEGIPVSIMEAMSYGIPCIARDVGGIREIVENGVNGFLLPRECTAEILSNEILQALNMSENERLMIRSEAFRKFIDMYNAETNYPHFWKTILKDSSIF